MTDDATTTLVPPTTLSRWRRNLRIGMSVFFGLMTVALCVLWVRSYWYWDALTTPIDARNESIVIISSQMILRFHTTSGFAPEWRWLSRIEDDYGTPPFLRTPTTVLGLGLDWNPYSITVLLPYWFLSTISGFLLLVLISPIWRFSPQFSLRTLLIATTLIAAVLGLGVWLAS